LKILLEFLKKNFKEIVFCGDFNAPRGGEIFSAFADRYKDNIPEKYKTSLDSSHKGYGKPWWETTMVDGIFSTPRYIVKNVIFHKGLSDHQAVTAEIFLTDNIKY
jgi:endonuclease/exonuclease/phosphatase family metal-dependent hydrolase